MRILDRLYERFDLYGPDGRPSNAKVLLTLGFCSALPGVLVWGGLEAYNSTVSFESVTALAVVLGLPFGLDGLKAAIKIRGPGPSPTFPGHLTPAPQRSPGAEPTETEAADLLPPAGQSRPGDDP